MTSAALWLDELVKTSVLPLFQGFELVDDPPSAGCGTGYAAVVGFTGERVRGALGIIASQDAIRDTYPESSLKEQVDPHDWVGELANQALGRMKSGLLRTGIAAHTAIPVVLSGVSLAVVPTEQVRVFVLTNGVTRVFLWVDYSLTSVLPPQADDRGDPLDKEVSLEFGATVLF